MKKYFSKGHFDTDSIVTTTWLQWTTFKVDILNLFIISKVASERQKPVPKSCFYKITPWLSSLTLEVFIWLYPRKAFNRRY